VRKDPKHTELVGGRGGGGGGRNFLGLGGGGWGGLGWGGGGGLCVGTSLSRLSLMCVELFLFHSNFHPVN